VRRDDEVILEPCASSGQAVAAEAVLSADELRRANRTFASRAEDRPGDCSSPRPLQLETAHDCLDDAVELLEAVWESEVEDRRGRHQPKVLLNQAPAAIVIVEPDHVCMFEDCRERIGGKKTRNLGACGAAAAFPQHAHCCETCFGECLVRPVSWTPGTQAEVHGRRWPKEKIERQRDRNELSLFYPETDRIVSPHRESMMRERICERRFSGSRRAAEGDHTGRGSYAARV
jgi:hypothetical protein